MKKRFFVFVLLALLPLMAFSESVFTFYLGTDIQKGCHIDGLDNLFKDLLLKKFANGSDKDVPFPKSKVLIPMLSVGLDMQFVSKKNGFTFFWNHAFLYADHAVGYNVLNITSPDGEMKASIDEKRTSFKNKFYVYSSEMLFGGTFRRENAFNIHFGVGFKTQFNPGMIWDAIGIWQGSYPNSTQIYLMLAGFGGTFGFSYYFNDIVGLTFSISDFAGLGGAVAARLDGTENMKDKGYPSGGSAILTLGVNNNFAMKFGLSLRVNGTRGDSL